MGTILSLPTWESPPEYLIERSAFWGIAWIWWNGCIVQSGRDMIFQEVPFGGYRVRITIKESFWNARSSAWRHDDILENLYAMAPGSSTPISTGSVYRIVRFFPTLNQYVVVIQSNPSDGHYRFQAFPFAPENAGSLNPPSDLPNVFFGDNEHPGQILPPVYC